MPQILDHFFSLAYGQICLSDQEASLSWDAIPAIPAGRGVLAEESTITLFVADEETEDPVEVEVYLGADETPRLRDLQPVFNGPLHLANPGLLVFEPTGEEVLLREIPEGIHQVAIHSNGYPAYRLVVLIDGQSQNPAHDQQGQWQAGPRRSSGDDRDLREDPCPTGVSPHSSGNTPMLNDLETAVTPWARNPDVHEVFHAVIAFWARGPVQAPRIRRRGYAARRLFSASPRRAASDAGPEPRATRRMQRSATDEPALLARGSVTPVFR